MIEDFINSLSILVSSGLFVDELKHGLTSLTFALAFYFKTKSIKYSLLVVLITYLIDADHLVDYFLYYGNNFSFTKFLQFDYFIITKRAVVPFHAWEWVALLSMLAYEKKKYRLQLSAVAVGIFAHLVWDSYTVSSVIFYSIIYRIAQGFMIL